MAADAVYDAIKSYLQTPATIAGLADPITGVVPPFRFENENFTMPDPPAPWIDVTLTGVIYAQQSLGASTQAANRWDEAGHLWLPVYVEQGTGGSRPRQLAKLLADLFRGNNTLLTGLEFMDAFIGEGAPVSETGNWFKLPVIIEWRRIDA